MRDLGSCKRRAKRRAQAAIIAAALGFGAQNVASVAPSISNGLFENRAIFGAESAQTANRPMTAQAAKENRPTEFKAFFVGVHNYAEATDLPYAKKDVEDLAARFVEIGFKEKNVTVLKVDDKLGFDNWPTQKNIEARFGEFVNSLEKGDFAVLYLSGHGFQNDAGEAYFAPTDVTADNPFGTSVSIDWMLERLGESDADFCWAIVDACRNNLKEDGAKTPRQMFTGVRSFGPKDLAADFKNAPKTVSILRSCTPGQCSYEGGDGVENGLFTRALLEAFDPNNLKANGADGDLRFFEIISYVMKRTEELADACGVKQNPVEGGQAERSDFTLLTGLPTSEEEPAELIVKGEEGETGGSSGTSTIWILLAVGGAAGGAFWLRRNPERVKAALEKTKAFATSVASSRGVGKRIQEVKKRNEKAKLASVNGLLDEALKACETENYKTARDKCEEALREAETSDANETRKKADDARKLLKEIEKAASARAKTLYGEALKAYNAEDYATARAKCEESLKAKQTPEARELLSNLETAAKKLFVDALTLYNAKDYASARDKCQKSLAAWETTAALKLASEIEEKLSAEEARKRKTAQEWFEKASKAFKEKDYETASRDCQASLDAWETSEARAFLRKIDDVLLLNKVQEAKLATQAETLYGEALKAYNAEDYATARAKCEESLKAKQTPEALKLRPEIETAATKRANELFEEALRFYVAENYATANVKCQASLAAKETPEALALQPKIESALLEEEAKAARAKEALDEARKAFGQGDYKTARDRCEASLAEVETSEARILLEKIKEAERAKAAALEKAKALYDEALSAYDSGDYKTARRKCEASLKEAETSDAFDLKKTLDEDAAKRAKTLFDEALRAYDSKDYPTAQRKCEASLEEAETVGARELLKMLKAARRVQEAEAATILKRANKALDEARRARDKRDYKTARVKCEEALKEAEKLNTDELRKKANEARELSRGLETIAKATANALYDEAFKAYRERDYATARRKCEESLNAFEMSATRELRREIDDAEKADAAAREAQAKRLCDEAFKAGDVGDYATARRKCEESLKAAETSAARDAAEAARKTKTPSRDRSTSAAFGWGAVYEAGTRKTLSAAGIEYALRYCPAQTFWMGSPANEEGRADDETLRKVTLTRGFWILETPVTQAMWTSIMGKNPSEFPASGSNALKFPVENVSWFDCLDFINKLNATVNLSDGLALRLPTEAEWEAACRAGTDGPYAGLRLDDLGWYFNNSGSRTRAVKTKAANPWGVSDMHGNVLEWCWDWMAPCDATSATDPKGPNKGTFRVLRGGGWCSLARCCRSAHRDGLVPSNRSGDSGFRLVLGSRF